MIPLDIDFISVIDHLGTFAFAISGIRLAATAKFDWFGAYIVGLATAIGGGTTRDIFLGVTPFWMQQESYLIVTAVAFLTVLLFESYILHMNKTLFLFDAIGLGLFTVVGIEKTLDNGFPFWVAIIMGMVTGAVGGVIRDVLINETPLIFRKDVYAMACIIGGIVFFICQQIGILAAFSASIAALSVIIIRVLAVTYHMHIPVFRPRERKTNK